MAKTFYAHIKEILDEMENMQKQLRKEHQNDKPELKAYLLDFDNSVVAFRQMLEEAKKSGISEKLVNEYHTVMNINLDISFSESELNELAAMTGMKPLQAQKQLDQIKIQASKDEKQKRKSDSSSTDDISDITYNKAHNEETNNIKVQRANATKHKNKQVEQTCPKQQTKSVTQAQFDELDAMYQEMFLRPQLTDDELQAMSDFYGFPVTAVIAQWKQRRLSEIEYQKHQKKRRKKALFRRDK